ncbi:hypothetical protein [Geochorda subterranea]|uniref:CopG-like ribbon-helix-helix domain-containing protein n=1 Tax=Geochorda subterranea TaxID=3109564 RepID=A0ABZ1BPX3_9FIRM|nr:hypothetical protein [Limnochorda sp. LNt]WRP14598.1 hypothetical protein VLY81_00045 [Limnochorda sp. LNt]
MPDEKAAEDVVLSIRVPKELRRRVKAQAAVLDLTVQEVIISLLENWLDKVEASQGPAEQSARGASRGRQKPGATRA